MKSSSDASDRALQTQQVLQLALLASVGVLIVVAWLLTRAAEPLVEAGLPVWGGVLVVAAGLLILADPLARRVAASLPDQAASAEATAMQRATMLSVLRGALYETVAVLGLVATLLSGNLFWAVLLGLLAGAALVFSWPRRQVSGSAL